MAILKTSDGTNIYYKYYGRKNSRLPIVFLHGIGLDFSIFKEQIKHFKKEKHPVITMDLRGHGKSDKGKTVKDYSLKRLVKDLEELLETIKLKNKIVLVGYSLGGMISLKYAENNKKIEKLIIVNSSDKEPEKHQFIKKIIKYNKLKEIIKYIENKKIETKTSDNKYEEKRRILYFVKQTIKNNPYSMIELVKTIYSKNKITPKKILAPTMIIASLEDEFFSEKQELRLAKKIKKSIIKIFPEKHDLPLKKPELITQEIKQFIYTKEEYFEK